MLCDEPGYFNPTICYGTQGEFQMLKRIIFFLLTNLAVLVTFNIILAVMGGMFGVRIDPNTYGGLLFFCLIYGLLGSFVSLWLSKWTALHLTDGRVISTPQTEEENQ